MSSAIPSVERLPVELWEHIIVDILYEELWMHISFTPRSDHTLGVFYPHVKNKSSYDKKLSWENISISPEFKVLRAVCKTWKATTERYSYLFRSRAIVGNIRIPLHIYGEVVGLTVYCCNAKADRSVSTLSTWRDQMKESPRLVFLNINESDQPSNHSECSQIENLVAVSGSLRTLKLLRMRVRSKGSGVMKLLSKHFPFLVHLDIRIQFRELDTSITDIEHLHMPNLDTLRIDTDRWKLYEAAISSWGIPNLRILNLAANGRGSFEVNPTAQMVKMFFDKFGMKITHAAFMIRVEYDKDWLVDRSSIPNMREIINPQAIHFSGPPLKEPKSERIVFKNIFGREF